MSMHFADRISDNSYIDVILHIQSLYNMQYSWMSTEYGSAIIDNSGLFNIRVLL